MMFFDLSLAVPRPFMGAHTAVEWAHQIHAKRRVEGVYPLRRAVA